MSALDRFLGHKQHNKKAVDLSDCKESNSTVTKFLQASLHSHRGNKTGKRKWEEEEEEALEQAFIEGNLTRNS